MLGTTTQDRKNYSYFLPEGPNLWKVHLVTRGKTAIMGSVLFSWFMPEYRTTSVPYFKKAPPRNTSTKNMLPTCVKTLFIRYRDIITNIIVVIIWGSTSCHINHVCGVVLFAYYNNMYLCLVGRLQLVSWVRYAEIIIAVAGTHWNLSLQQSWSPNSTDTPMMDFCNVLK